MNKESEDYIRAIYFPERDYEEERIIDLKEELDSYSKNREEKARIAVEKSLVALFYNFNPYDQTRLLAIVLDYPDEIINDLNLELKVMRDINFMILFTFTLLTANEYKRKLSKILSPSEGNKIRINRIFKKIIFREELLNSDRILTKKTILELVEPEFEFFELVLDRNKFLFKPNKKYSTTMFDFTSELIFKGKKEYVAFMETLEQFGFDAEKSDSYRKSYKKHLKK